MPTAAVVEEVCTITAKGQTTVPKAEARLLAALRALVLDRIPHDPLAPEFRQGNTLGKAEQDLR